MDSTLDDTTLATLTLLESRLLRVEHLLYGRTGSSAPAQGDMAIRTFAQLERRFSHVLSEFRVYEELLKIYKANPDFFHPPDPSLPPSDLTLDALRAIVLASASSYPAIVSALTAVQDCQIPDPAESAALISQSDRMKSIEATQLAQAAELSELRGRSERLVRAWYEGSMLQNSHSMADVEGRVAKVEQQVRRAERQRDVEEV